MNKQKRRRWPVRWSETEENLIIEGAKLKNLCPTKFIQISSINKASFLLTDTNVNPQTNEQKLRRKIFDYQIKEGWVGVANSLQETAKILKSSRDKYSDFSKIICHELLIWGFCLENLLKGLYSKKQATGALKNSQAKPLNDDGELSLNKRDHDLEKWCQRAEVTNFNSNDQKRILRTLTQIILHHGRYPVPSKWSNSEGFYWDDDQCDRILLEMINLLHYEISKID